MHYFLVFVNFISYFSSVNVIFKTKILITIPKLKQKMTPAILLVLSILTIHFRHRLFDLLSFPSTSHLDNELYVEVFIPFSLDGYGRSFISYRSITIKPINSLLKILDRDYTTGQVHINSLEYPKTTDGLDYLFD